MNSRQLIIVCFAVFASLVSGAVISDDGDVEEQGLYRKSDKVVILTQRNFVRKVYAQNRPLIVQFYNSYCGHCRAFSPKYKSLAAEIQPWENIIKLAALDCSEEENNEICRQFEVMAYPSLRYIHENYIKANANVGEQLSAIDTAEKLKTQIIHKMQQEQAMGRLNFAPPLSIASYPSFTAVLADVPNSIMYTFLVFESENSTVGSELALDINDYSSIRVKRVYETSELVNLAGVSHFPGLVAVRPTLEATPLTPKNPSKANLLKAVNTFLLSKNYVFPIHNTQHTDSEPGHNADSFTHLSSDTVYYSDLEKTIKLSLHTEVTRHKVLTGEPLQALLNYLDVLLSSFPFRGNLQEYIQDLRNKIATRTEWSGADLFEIVKQLEKVHAPVYVTNMEYVSCQGSQLKYRGYTCGLWTLFHTLTVNAALRPGQEGPKVLHALHGYVKHFFGCTECAQHFQAMAARNKLFDVKENEKAVLWLWISHNEVNLRLAGDITEDPEHPKLQFPSVSKCRECRLARGAWSLPAVYQYLQMTYSSGNIRDVARKSALAAPSPFSNLDLGMLSLLMIVRVLVERGLIS